MKTDTSYASGELYDKLSAETINVLYMMALKYRDAASKCNYKQLDKAAELTEKAFKYFKRCIELKNKLKEGKIIS